MNSNITRILVWVAIVGVIFAIAWWQGYLLRISNYVAQTREELKKCTWPTWDELKGSTVIVAISIALLGGFTVAADLVFVYVTNWIYKV